MELREGENVGPFQVQKRIGAGGMGVVYRARDTRLGRDVAIKVLPAVVSSDPDRLARIRREAQLLASLNHPHIAAIHGLEEVDGQPLLVLELVEGPDLSDRLSRGRLAVEDAVDLARQMAEALEAAHAKGIIHRDLKPGNIKLTEDGAIKILDFGLAKAFLEEGVDASSQLSHSPTISRPATATGAIMGTAAYMSPEQAKGKHLDRRTDIWSFGCVLFEMLVGRKVFSGETVSETLAEILKSEPDWSALPSDVPEPVRRLLQRALTKDPKHRLRDIGDAWVTLSEASGGGPNPVMAVAAPSAARSKRVSIGAAVVIAALASIVSAIVAVRRDREPSPEAHPVRRFTLRLGERPLYSVWSNIAVSPKGNLVAFLTRLDGSRKLVLRHFEKETDDLVPESNDASYLFFSPDGEWVAFITAPESNSGSPRHGTLKRVRVSGGGAPVTIREEVFAGGGIWLDDDTIVFQSGDGERLERISSSGGASNPLTLPPGGGLWFPVDGVPGSRDLLLVNGGGRLDRGQPLPRACDVRRPPQDRRQGLDGAL